MKGEGRDGIKKVEKRRKELFNIPAIKSRNTQRERERVREGEREGEREGAITQHSKLCTCFLVDKLVSPHLSNSSVTSSGVMSIDTTSLSPSSSALKRR